MNILIITDLRSLPLLTSLFLYRRLNAKGSKVQLVMSYSIISCNDFGHFFPKWFKVLKVNFIKFFFDLKIIDFKKNKNIYKDDLISINSSLCSITSNSLANKEKYPILYDNLRDLVFGAKDVIEYLENFNLNTVYIFNGRTASSSPILTYLWSNKIRTFFYEYGNKFGSNFTIYDFPIHNAYEYGLRLVDFYNSNELSKSLIEESGFKFIKQKLNNSFVKNYKIKINKKYDIAIFLGSDHEYSNLNSQIYGIELLGNLELIKSVYQKYGESKRYAVRAHPNQKSDVSWKVILLPIVEFCRSNSIDFFEPNSDISSYSLIENSDIIVVELSSICTEAIILGKTVDIFGNNSIKAILDSCPNEIKKDKNLLSKYLSEVLSLSDFLFHYKLPPTWSILKVFIFRIDWLILKLHKIKLN